MNIFILDLNTERAAQYHCDKHVVKMVLETAQILCAVFPKGEAPYKRTHYNHPCTIWARESKANYLWLIEFGKSLAKEYEFRYNRIHKSLAVIKWCENNINSLSLPCTDMTEPAQAMPEDYQHMDVVHAYRTYYLHDKAKIATWNKARSAPYWWQKDKQAA